MESEHRPGSSSHVYPSIGKLYDRMPEMYTPGQLNRLLRVMIEQMPERIQTISDFLYGAHAIRITPESDEATLDQLPFLIADVGGQRKPEEWEVEEMLLTARPAAVEMLRQIFSQPMIDDQTVEMVFDAGLLWGEAFRRKYPMAEWKMGRLPRSSIFYGRPVIVGVDRFKNEFNPVGQLSGLVTAIIEKKPPGWPLSRRNKRQGVDLGFHPVRIHPEDLSS